MYLRFRFVIYTSYNNIIATLYNKSKVFFFIFLQIFIEIKISLQFIRKNKNRITVNCYIKKKYSSLSFYGPVGS